MKKCPYCAEEIKDKAIVCRYCGRDLQQTPTTTARLTTSKPSVWVQAVKISTVFTVLGAIVLIYRLIENGISPAEDASGLVLVIVFNFACYLVFWAGIVWLWRKAGNNTFWRVIVIMGVVIVFCILFNLSNSLVTSSPTPTETPVRIIPTRTPKASCVPWYEVTKFHVGTTICVYGVIAEKVQPILGKGVHYFTFRFTTANKNSFYITTFPYWAGYDLTIGDCIIARAIVKLDGQIPYMNTTAIFRCSSGLSP